MPELINTSHFLPLGSVRAMERTARGLVLNVGEERFRVDVLRPDVLRLKISQAKIFDEAPTFAVVDQSSPTVPFEVKQEDDTIVLETERMRLLIRRDVFALAAYRKDGTVIFEDAQAADGSPMGYLQLNDEFVVTRRIGAHDSIYGLGEKTGAFDRRGRNFTLWNTDVLQPGVLEQNRLSEVDQSLTGASTKFDPYYTSIPFFYHCQGDGEATTMSGFFVDNGYKGRFEFGHADTYRYHFEGGQYTEYVFAGPSMPEVLEAYTELTGRIAPPPIWALGLHQCRFHDYDQDDIVRLANEYRSREIPCDVLWLDIGYMNGFRVFTWNTQRFSDVGAMVNQLTENAFRLVVIVDPGVKFEPGNPVFEEGYAKGYFCKTESGKLYVGQVWPGRTVFPDFSREEVRSWWGELNARHASVGIAGIWNDMNEPATGDVAPFAMRFDRDGENHPHERFHNQYAMLMAMGTHEGLTTRYPEQRPFILSRAGFAGIQRYAAQWTGDNQSDWSHLEMSVPMSTGLSVSGQPFVGSDVPGFIGRATPELAVRWVQYGALTPFCRFHKSIGEADQYPWSFGKGVELRSRAAIELRYRLLPYIYSTFVEASRTGAPVMRPLAYHFQGDRQARETDDTYMFGPALLVAPVLRAGCTARNVYLPGGTWVDWHSGEVHQGARYITAQAPLDHVPLFARGGAVVPTCDEVPRSTMGHFPERLVLNLFVPGEDGEFVSELREDDGVTTHHERGHFWHTTFVVRREGKRLSLRATVSGKGFDEFRRTAFRLVVRGAEAQRVLLNGGETQLEQGSVEFDNRAEGFELEVDL